MESEKVKEIKKALECCSEGECGVWCPRFDKKNINHTCQDDMNAEALTLINELESENERLSNTEIGELVKENEELAKQCMEWSELNFKKRKQVVKLKDRIAELEKKNARLLDSVETVQSNRCVYKCVLTKEHLTKFAERLKEKCEYNRKQYCCSATVGVNDIDEPLKEFINE